MGPVGVTLIAITSAIIGGVISKFAADVLYKPVINELYQALYEATGDENLVETMTKRLEPKYKSKKFKQENWKGI